MRKPEISKIKRLRGVIGKRIMSIWLDKVQDVTCRFGILGRIFGFGDIEIESAGTYGKVVFNLLPSPRQLQEKLETAILDFHRHHSAEYVRCRSLRGCWQQ